jgi:hypothetical protein
MTDTTEAGPARNRPGHDEENLMDTPGVLDLAAYLADIDRAHIEVGDIAAGGYRRWRMSIPARPDRDSDLLISAGLYCGKRLADEVERLRAAAEFALTALEGAETACRYHGETPPEAPAWHGGCESCQQPTRVREALAAIRALTAKEPA